MRAAATRGLVGASVLAVALAGCGTTTAQPSSSDAARYGTATAGDLALTRGWVSEVDVAPSSPMTAGGSGSMAAQMSGTSAAYFTIRDTGAHADALVSARSSAADHVQLHGTTRSADGSSGTMTDVAAIAVPAQGSTALAPGGYHLMLVHPVRSLRAGQHVRIVLTFRSGTVMTVSLPVLDREDRPGS